MPINLNETDRLSSLIAGLPAKITPKIYDKELTGTGYSNVGFFKKDYHTLQDLYDNSALYDDATAALTELEYARNKQTLSDIHSASFPLSDSIFKLTHALSWLDFERFDDQWTTLGQIHDTNSNEMFNIYVTDRVETITKIKHKDKNKKSGFIFSVRSYVLIVNTDVTKLNEVNTYLTTWDAKDAQTNLAQSKSKHSAILLSDSAYINGNQTNELIDHLDELFENRQIKDIINPSVQGTTFKSFKQALTAYIKNDNIASLLTTQALELTQHLISDVQAIADSFAETMAGNYDNTELYQTLMLDMMDTFSALQHLVDNYLTADDFTQLYLTLAKHQNQFKLQPNEFNQLLTTSLRLLLAKSLSQLKVLSDNNMLYKFEPTDMTYNQYVNSSSEFSKQQKQLILTTKPLTIGTAGAGSGKSHTLVGRLAYLKGEGEDLSKAMVLSFTNTAADNIKRRYPNINSITLGNLFNQIYHTMYADQELSAAGTVMNSLSLLDVNAVARRTNNPNVSLLNNVRQHLVSVLSDLNPQGFKQVDHNQALSELSQLIADYSDEVITLLDAIKQTTLELQPVIIYNLIMANHKISLPKQYQDINYIITDESQDISTFEYILLTTLTAKYKANLMIMGDGTQTLYEFRSSNPRFLNAIESSGIFQSYKLTTNYRSNGAILKYANEFLDVIDANKYAHLKLEPNSLAPVDLNQFNEDVQIADYGLKETRGNDYINGINERMTQDPKFIQWVHDKLDHHEQIALMAFTRAETKMLNTVMETITKQRANQPKILDITPDRTMQDARLSKAVRSTYHDIIKAPLNKYAQTVADLIQENIINGFYHKDKAFIPRYVITALQDTFNAPRYQALRNDVFNQKINRSALDRYVVNQLLQAEIHYNAMYQLIKRDDNDKTSQAARDSADILISTIHSAKGLEFDNTVVVFNEAKRSATSQSSLRLYGVALTRAKNHEYVINIHHKSAKNTRTVTSNQSDMFKTPMMTAQLRCQDELSTN